MKTLIVVLILLLLFSNQVFAIAPVSLVWDDSPSEDNVVSYKVYASAASNVFPPESFIMEVFEPTADIVLPTKGVWYLRITAINSYGESGFSDEVNDTYGRPDAPVNIRKRKITVMVTVEDG
jgi:hypothetical protein